MDAKRVNAFFAELKDADYIEAVPYQDADGNFDGSGDITLFCIAHEDPATSQHASASWNPVADNEGWDLGVFQCYKSGCDLPHNGIEVKRLWDQKNGRKPEQFGNPDNWKTPETAKKPRAIRKKRRADLQPEMDADDIEYATEELFGNKERLEWWLKEKLLKPETLRKFGMMWYDRTQCYLFPVYRIDGELEGRRIYDPFHLDGDRPLPKKRWNRTRDAHTNQLWGFDQADLSGNVIVLAEGETDCMLMHQDGYVAAVAQTGGAGTWKPEWNVQFAGKTVAIAYDADEAGNDGAALVARSLENVAGRITRVEFPNGMDYCDWRMKGKHKAAEFAQLIEDAKELWSSDAGELPTEGEPIANVGEVKDPALTERPVIQIKAYIAGKTTEPWVLPRLAAVSCKQNKGKTCDTCPMTNGKKGERSEKEFELRPDKHNSLIAMMGAEAGAIKKLLQGELNLGCGAIEVERKSDWMVEQVNLQDPIESSVGITSDDRYSAFHFYGGGDSKISATHDYTLIGRTLADPRSQQLTVACWNAEQTSTDLDSFKLTAEMKRKLKRLRPKKIGFASLDKHLKARYNDLSINVTKIVAREDIHMLWDLTAHSAAYINHGGSRIKGVMDVMVIGDTRTGKSETVKMLNAHAGVGTPLVSGENTSFAGLIGGSAEVVGSRSRMPQWGILPRQHGRFVAIDEVSGLGDLMGSLSSVRSSGQAEINKMGGGSVPALVRLMWLSNPVPHDKSNTTRQLIDFNDGAVQALQDLIKAQEDIARFDMVMAAPSRTVDQRDDIVRMRGMETPHTYTSELVRLSIMFAWTRTTDQVLISPEVDAYINEATRELCGKYTDKVPLVQSADMDHKLARMAVACAAMVYSTDESGECIVVRKEHVQAVRQLLEEAYDSPAMGYARRSKREHKATARGQVNSEPVARYFRGEQGVPEFAHMPDGIGAYQIISALSNGFTVQEYQQNAAVSGSSDNGLVLLLSGMALLRRAGNRFVPTPALTQVLRDLEDEDDAEQSEEESAVE